MFVSATSPFQGITSKRDIDPRIDRLITPHASDQSVDAFIQQKKLAPPVQVASLPHFGKIVNITVLDETHGNEQTRKEKLDTLLNQLSITHNAKHVIRGHFEGVNKTMGVFFDSANDPLENKVMSILWMEKERKWTRGKLDAFCKD